MLKEENTYKLSETATPIKIVPKQSLTIDFHQEKASQQILPRVPLLSSHKAGWEH